MRKLILNVGLAGIAAPEQGYTNGVANRKVIMQLFTAVRTLRMLNFKVGTAKLVDSDTEPTLVVEVTHGGDPVACLNWACDYLNQDCIAMLDMDSAVGALVGPRAEAWGVFDPERFLMLAGNRLSESTETV
jgi:hypothetical protein